MRKNEQLDHIIDIICRNKLGNSIDAMENYILSHPSLPGQDVFYEIKSDYHLMVDYFKRGYADPQRVKVYSQLLKRLYVFATNTVLYNQIQLNSYLQGVYQRPRQLRNDWSVQSIKKLLESYVTDSALLELEPQHVAAEKSKELNRQHLNLMHDIFDYILTSNLWNDSLYDAFLDLLLSPTIDVNDQLLLVSAIMMSSLNVFDINKFKVLTSLYQQTTDVRLRQRALVGWVFSLDIQKEVVYPEMKQIVYDLCHDEDCLQELTELQMQLFFCIDIDNDQRTIQNEIIPNLMNGGPMNLRISPNGLVETDEEDKLEDILHPEESERNMEKMEKSMHRMSEMQKQGSDIYFGGFSQMKRFPFFQNSLSNWFAPFNPNHPDISAIWNEAKNSKFLHMIINMGGFCDSDRYSFVLAFEQVRSHLPASMMKMIDEGHAAPMPIGGQIDKEERKKPAFIRRMYLQSLYRFYRLHYMRREFPNPFEDQSKYLFFANGLFSGTPFECRLPEVTSFLLKRHRKEEASYVLFNNAGECDTYDYHILSAYLGSDPEIHYRRALELIPNNERALSGLAKVMFRQSEYKQALDIYQQLMEINPEKKSYQLNKSVCLINLHRYDEAELILFRLNYENAGDQNVIRVLAWALTCNGKYEQAGRLYHQLMAEDSLVDGDLINYGIYLWLTGKIGEAADCFRTYNSKHSNDIWNSVSNLIGKEERLLNRNGICEEEITMMFDIIGV